MKRTIMADDVEPGLFSLEDDQIKGVLNGEVKKCGNGGHVRIKPDFIEHRAYVVIQKTGKNKAENGSFNIEDDEIETIFEGTIKKCGNAAHIGVPRAYLGKEAYVAIRDTKA